MTPVLALSLLLVASVPSAPSIAPTQQTVTPSQRVAWDANPTTDQVTRYEVAIDQQSYTSVGLALEYPLSALTNGAHAVQVRACNASGCGPDASIAVVMEGATDPEPPPPDPDPQDPPEPGTPSPDGTRIPPATEIVDAEGAVWTLPWEKYVRRNDEAVGSVQAFQIAWCGGAIWVERRVDSRWARYEGGTTWTLADQADPCTVAEPPPPPDPVDCVVSAWNAWSDWAPISETVEQRTRTRTIETEPAHGGAACPALVETETRPIAAPPDPCVVDPLVLAVTGWPAGDTGRQLRWRTNYPARIQFDPFAATWTVTATDARGCQVEVSR